MEITLLFKSGSAVRLSKSFIVGTGIAGTTNSGVVMWFNESTIEQVISH